MPHVDRSAYGWAIAPPDTHGPALATILITDDEPDLRVFVRAVLTRNGHEVLEAAHGAEALEVLAEHRVDVLITDLHMPVMDGHELLAALRDMDGHRPFTIIWSTDRMGLTGADLALDKPCPAAALPDAIATAMATAFGDAGGVAQGGDEA